MIKITSLNLQGFDDWEVRSPRILEYLSGTDPDIILFQEAVFLPTISPYNQAQLLNHTLGYPFEVSAISRLQVGIEYPVYREGLAILSKHPVISSDTIALQKAEGDKHNRILQMVDIQFNDQIIRLGNVHFSVTDIVDYATPHLQETLDILAARHEKRILIGDFNLSDIEGSADLWRANYQASTEVPYISYPAMNKRIDYTLIPRGYRFESIEVSGDGLSDHRALTVMIDLSGR